VVVAERKRLTGTARLLFAIPFLLLLGITALLANSLAPYDPLGIDARNILQGPSTTHPFGTDELGRDILSRLMHGARISLSVAIAAVVIASVLGVIVGILASYARGQVENLVMRVIDIFVCLPEIFVAIVIMAFLEHGLRTLIITIGVLYFPQFARVAYSVARSLREKEYVVAAVSLGARPLHIIVRALLPNMASVIVVQVSFTLSFAMLLEAGLSFLGLGLMPPAPSWGQMVGTLKDYLFTNAWPVVFPSLALFLSIFAINTFGDWLQDYLNPEMTR
jgi:peptide/nickel transport system permease protein